MGEAKLQILKDEGVLGKIWNLSYYKKGSPTHMTHSSFTFFKGREKLVVGTMTF